MFLKKTKQNSISNKVNSVTSKQLIALHLSVFDQEAAKGSSRLLSQPPGVSKRYLTTPHNFKRSNNVIQVLSDPTVQQKVKNHLACLSD